MFPVNDDDLQAEVEMFRKMFSRVLCLSVAIAVLLPLTALAKTLYVKSKGSGSSCSKSKPCSMSTGISKSRSGDTVVFKSGTYTRNNLVTKKSNVTYKAERKGKAIIKTKKSPLASIKHSGTTLDGLVFDGQSRTRGIDLSQASGNLSNIRIRNCTVKNVRDIGIVVKPRRGRKLSRITIENNTIDGTGKRGVGEAVYLGNDRLRIRGGRPVVEVENVSIKRNKFRNFTDNCVDMKPGARRVTMSNNTCERQLRARGGRNHGTIVVRGLDNKVYNNKIDNVLGGQAVFNVAARGGNRVYNNTVRKSTRTNLAIRTRERGYGSKASEVKNNTFYQLSSKRISARFGLKVSGNKFR